MGDKNSNVHQPGERIAKVIARAGLASRREAEAWIAAKRVAVNGMTITSPAVNVTPKDAIAVDGQPLPHRERTRLFLFHKPRGLVTTTRDPEGRPTIFTALPSTLPRLVTVGRLDLNTEGLLLLTNDGGLARVLELPATGWLRRYRVRAHGQVAQAQLDQLRNGVTIDGMRYGSIDATLDQVRGANAWLTVAIREGKKREVRNVLAHLGLQVNRLIRVSFGPFQLGDLPVGEIIEVKTRTLRDQLGERLAKLAGVDFTGPIAHLEPQSAPASPGGRGAKPGKSKGPPQPSAAKLQSAGQGHPSNRIRETAGHVSDRKGRRISTERIGEPELARRERKQHRRSQRTRTGKR
jgi:23S rRNA pseudouridine2605 synthase